MVHGPLRLDVGTYCIRGLRAFALCLAFCAMKPFIVDVLVTDTSCVFLLSFLLSPDELFEFELEFELSHLLHNETNSIAHANAKPNN